MQMLHLYEKPSGQFCVSKSMFVFGSILKTVERNVNFAKPKSRVRPLLTQNKANMHTTTGKCIHVPSKAIAPVDTRIPISVMIIGKCMPQRWKSTIEIGSVSPLAAPFSTKLAMVFAKPKIERGNFLINVGSVHSVRKSKRMVLSICKLSNLQATYMVGAIVQILATDYRSDRQERGLCYQSGAGLPNEWNGSNERSLSMIVFYEVRAEKKTWPHSWKWRMAGKRAKTGIFRFNW